MHLDPFVIFKSYIGGDEATRRVWGCCHQCHVQVGVLVMGLLDVRIVILLVVYLIEL